ncbi:calponin homology domain-containing protein DDB_G0272472-like [Seriola aureovittata]|uniref:calponin homology domain-containing protein DDB_G0272472-like n=1 Tax=Seriola aureovittata TaxID=2871759 RepID=UPI0024BD97E2|nr:calponin homology domain-containing protein DDB_G0272472-like [Seriola aureovittata]
MLQALRRALLDAKRQNQELEAENAALKQEAATKVVSWEEEKKRLLEEKESLQSNLLMAQSEKVSMSKIVESERAAKKHLEAEIKEKDNRMRKEEREVRSLKERLCLQQAEKEKFKVQWMQECARVQEMDAGFDQSIIQFTAAWESRLAARERRAVAELKALQESCEKRVAHIDREREEARAENLVLVELNFKYQATIKTINSEIQRKETEWQKDIKSLEETLRCEMSRKEEELQEQNRKITQERDEAVASARAENMVLVDQNLKYLANMKTAEAEIQHKETERQKDISALQEKLRCELTRKEEELQEQRRLTEESWLTRQADWMKKASGTEEEIQRLILQNVELQELALKSDKDKAKIRKKEEKRLKKERKEKKEQEKKEEMEREKKERKAMKEKKEKERMETKERKKREKEKERREATFF